jgi:hypothetical protein
MLIAILFLILYFFPPQNWKIIKYLPLDSLDLLCIYIGATDIANSLLYFNGLILSVLVG